MESNYLALDANKWLTLVEEVENPKNVKKWKEYVKENISCVYERFKV